MSILTNDADYIIVLSENESGINSWLFFFFFLIYYRSVKYNKFLQKENLSYEIFNFNIIHYSNIILLTFIILYANGILDNVIIILISHSIVFKTHKIIILTSNKRKSY